MIISVEERDPRQDLVLGRCSPVFGQRFVHLFRLAQNLGSMGLAELNCRGPKCNKAQANWLGCIAPFGVWSCLKM